MPSIIPAGSMDHDASTSDEGVFVTYYNPLYEGSEKGDDYSDIDTDIPLGSDDEQNSDSSVETEEKEIPNRLTTRSAAFLMLLLFHFFRKISVSSTSPSVTLQFLRHRADLVHNEISKEPLLCEILNSIDLSNESLESILDRVNRSEVCVRETAPVLYANLTGDNTSTISPTAHYSTEDNTEKLIKYKLDKVKFSKIIQRYRYLLTTYKSFIISETPEDKFGEKFNLRDILDSIETKDSYMYGLVRTRLNYLEYKMRNKKNKDKINIIEEEMDVLDEIDQELKRYTGIFQDLLFYPFGVSKDNLENKLAESAQKLETLASDMYSACLLK